LCTEVILQTRILTVTRKFLDIKPGAATPTPTPAQESIVTAGHMWQDGFVNPTDMNFDSGWWYQQCESTIEGNDYLTSQLIPHSIGK
jgi:hypothetical protein